MATIVLSAAGMALGSSVGGAVAGLGMATIGRAVGATVGRVIDARLLGQGSDPVETGRVDRFRLTGASEGAPVAQLYGRSRIAGQVIWASDFLETTETTGGGKGGPPRPKTTEYSYTVSLAIALCEGVITHVNRVWADGVEVPRDALNMVVYQGTETQTPDPKMEAIEGTGLVPAYRGLAYVVFEDLPLGQFGNRVPQFSFEVSRPAQPGSSEGDLSSTVRGVALIPGSGEYALATTPVIREADFGTSEVLNINTPSGKSDLETSLDHLAGELPHCGSALLVVSWFGDDLRVGHCALRPKVESRENDPEAMPWTVAGLTRATAEVVAQDQGRPVYGGTPTDQSVIEAIHAMQAAGQEVVYYPFILMEQAPGNGLPDPYGGAEQPPFPWRGRITTSLAPGQAGSPDGTAAAVAEVDAFFGTASATDFTVSPGTVLYSGPDEWSYRRFILHQAALCAAAGGVEAFCIGSEMRGLTQIRGENNSFPAVSHLFTLAAEVRTLLPGAKLGYAADWSEYFGYQPGDGSRFFHLDPLWADPNIDFIGIDNYMPLSDWRDGTDHLDAGAGAIYNLDYLTANVAGGEGYDWYYSTPEARAAQRRTPITDGLDEEPWVWRYKDLKNWWSNAHYDRPDGVRSLTPTPWVPQSKPIWFTELGCPAVDKGANQPNVFVDPKSSESALPYFSNGLRDELIQMQYIRAVHRHYEDPVANPVSTEYGGPMVDLSRCHIWAWDARPYPAFPQNEAVWSDGPNYAKGHWITGRATNRTLASVVAEICDRAGLYSYDVSALHGLVRGYRVADVTSARAALQPLMLVHGFDAIERDGVLHFVNRSGERAEPLTEDHLALSGEGSTGFEALRAAEAEVTGRVRLTYVEADADYEAAAAEAIFPGEETRAVSATEVDLVLTRPEGRAVAERWLSEARLARDGLRLSLPPSLRRIGAGDVITLKGQPYRIDRVESTEGQEVEATRINAESYLPHEGLEDASTPRTFVPPVPIVGTFLDLPLLTGDEAEHAPHFAATGVPWPGSAALWSAPGTEGFTLLGTFDAASVVGTTLTPLAAAAPGHWDRGPALRVKLVRGTLQSREPADVLAGANALAIGPGGPDPWEVLQFASATLVSPGIYDLTLRLRGQAGTDGILPPEWPAGSRVVLLDGRPQQINLPASSRDVARTYRYGAATRSLSDPTIREVTHAFRGNGLRPYAPVHLRATEAGGALQITWTRRTRIDGDSWTAPEVPLGEATERYIIEIRQNDTTLRSTEVTSPTWTYTAAARTADGPATHIAVAQISDRFGPGPFRTLSL